MAFSRRKNFGNRDEFAVVLDVFLEYRNSYDEKELIQAVGVDYFTFLELVPKEGVELKPGDKVYIGSGKRDEILLIKRVLKYEQLTEDAKSELIFVLTEIVKEKEKVYVDFFNKAGPLTIRKHAIELIPGIGKKYLQDFLDERMKGSFESFEDISKRLPFLQDPARAIAERLLEELKGNVDLPFLKYWGRNKNRRRD